MSRYYRVGSCSTTFLARRGVRFGAFERSSTKHEVSWSSLRERLHRTWKGSAYPALGYADPCHTLLLPAGQNGFALKQLGRSPGQEDCERNQDNGGNDRHEDGEIKLAEEFAEDDPQDWNHRPY